MVAFRGGAGPVALAVVLERLRLAQVRRGAVAARPGPTERGEGRRERGTAAVKPAYPKPAVPGVLRRAAEQAKELRERAELRALLADVLPERPAEAPVPRREPTAAEKSAALRRRVARTRARQAKLRLFAGE